MSNQFSNNTVNLFTFWEGNNPPAYIDMCIDTWFKSIPNANLTVINYANINEWADIYVNINELKKYSFAMQSDVISSIILAKHGGVFIDADTILTGKKSLEFFSQDDARLKAFSIPHRGEFHVAVLSVKKNNPAVLFWMDEACKRVNSGTQEYPWNYLAGEILERLTKVELYKPDFNIIDRTISGNILESKYETDYKSFYFDKSDIEISEVIDSCKNDIISLHNSWTPKEYSALTDTQEIYNQPNLITKIFKHILGTDYELPKTSRLMPQEGCN